MKIIRFINSEDGTTAVEYAVMLMLIIAVCIAAIQLVGGETLGVWSGNSDSIDNALNN